MKIQLDGSQLKRAVSDYLCRVLHCESAPKITALKIRRKGGADETAGSCTVEIEEEQ